MALPGTAAVGNACRAAAAEDVAEAAPQILQQQQAILEKKINVFSPI